MSDFSNLQQTVQTAQEAYAQASEQHARSRNHLMSLSKIIDEQLREKRVELEQNEILRKHLTQEYEQLQHMTQALADGVANGTAAPDGNSEAGSSDPSP